MFGKKKRHAQRFGADIDPDRYLEKAIRAAQETLTHGGILVENPDNELTVEDVLTAGPEIVCPEIVCDEVGLPAHVIAWVRREAAYRTAVAYARHHDHHITRGDDVAVQAVIEDLCRQPLAVQAGFLNVAAVLP